MARLLYETIQFSPFVSDGEVELATQFEAAAAAGFDGVGIDGWSVDRYLANGGTVREAADLAYVQFNDALPLMSDDLMSETLQRRTLPGEGEFELSRFCEIVRAKGYDGPIAIEIMSATLRAEGAHEYARKTEAAARPYW